MGIPVWKRKLMEQKADPSYVPPPVSKPPPIETAVALPQPSWKQKPQTSLQAGQPILPPPVPAASFLPPPVPRGGGSPPPPTHPVIEDAPRTVVSSVSQQAKLDIINRRLSKRNDGAPPAARYSSPIPG